MKEGTPSPIPIPLIQRWHDARLRVLPAAVFLSCIGVIAMLWQGSVDSPMMVGQAEPVTVKVSSHKPGMLTEPSVVRFQCVKAGDPVALVMVADPKVLESSLAVVRAEIDLLRADMKPVATQQRNAINYSQLQLDWMRQRTALATARVNLQLTDSELRRTRQLFNDKIAAQQQLDVAEAANQASKMQVEELSKLVAELDLNIKSLQLTNGLEITKVSEKPLDAAIAVQEAKLRLVEAELSPLVLTSPIDGIVTTVFQRSGESVVPGQPILSIATMKPVRIVAYMRPPIEKEPGQGMWVEVRTRGWRRAMAKAQIIAVGTQYESIPQTLMGPIKITGGELGLPLEVSLPQSLNIHPGELVDISFAAVTQ
jgi:multidrug resistance efflux pump